VPVAAPPYEPSGDAPSRSLQISRLQRRPRDVVGIAADQKQPEEEQVLQKMIAFILPSQRRCMKKSATSEALIDAISMAMITFAMPPPKSTSDAPTVTTVRNKQRSQHCSHRASGRRVRDARDRALARVLLECSVP
jgi:hypothetical protein